MSLPSLTALLLRRWFFFLLLGILCAVMETRKNRRNELKSRETEWPKWSFIETRVFLLPLHQTYRRAGMKDGGRGDRATHTHPSHTCTCTTSPVRWIRVGASTYWLAVMQPLHQREGKRGIESGQRGLQSATPPLSTWQHRHTCSKILFQTFFFLTFCNIIKACMLQFNEKQHKNLHTCAVCGWNQSAPN